MSILDTLVTDRTRADVQRLAALNAIGWERMTADERGEWMLGKTEPLADDSGEQLYDINLEELLVRVGLQKGAYNASDLNRVGEACEYVVNRLNSLGGFNLHINAKTDWQREDIPTPAQMQTYLDNVSTIRAAYSVLAPQVPSDMEHLTFEEANDIEKILIAVDELLERVLQSFVYSGMVYSGMVWEEFV